MNFLVFLGSERDSTPPRPARLDLRVSQACVSTLASAGHEVSLIDPLDLNPSHPFKPHFSYAAGHAPPRPVAEPASLQFVRSAGATAACLIHVGGLATSTTTGIVEVARILEHEKTRQQRCRAPDRTGEFPELFRTCNSGRRGRRRTRYSCCRPSSTGSPGRRPGGRHRCCRDRG